jgi:hypothetical protein
MRTPRTILALSLLFAATAVPTAGGADRPAVAVGPASAADPDGVEFFEQHIRPVLAEHCYSCHSAQAKKLKGELLLDSRRGVAHGGAGGPVIVAGRPDQSRLIEAIRWADPDLRMPPTKPLTPQQVERFEQWVRMGAPDPRADGPATQPGLGRKPVSDVKPGRAWWALRPVERPAVPEGPTASANPIDAFVTVEHRAKGLKSVGPADKATLLRRVYLDLTGLPPTPAEQEAFLGDPSPTAYETVVDRLLASEQHGVRYARRWLDVLRYADADERMIAAPGIHLWRDWVINALNDDVPYDQFVRAQLTGYRSAERTQMSATGYRSRVEPRPDDLFALGLLARGAVAGDGGGRGELAINAVETVSTAFMGVTVGCAKCHDHLYDPVKQRDFYAMKALFDPLVPRKVTLATADERVASGRAAQQAADRRAPIEAAIKSLAAPYKKKLYDDRVAMLPAEVKAVVLKPEADRTAAEQKVADDYFPILRIDADKISAAMSGEDRRKHEDLQRQLAEAGRTPAAGGRRGGSLAAFWTVEVDRGKELEKSYVLTSGDPERPELDHEVKPGWPFAPATIDFRDGRLEAFSDWLTAARNPLFARVVVNRLWQWHFGEGLQKSPSDFGELGGVPSNPKLLDWLASELVRKNFSMKAMHRLIVTSDAYKRASDANPSLAAANAKADPTNAHLWRFRLQRLDAEPIWDSIFAAAGTLDPTVGGPSFDLGGPGGRRGGGGLRAAEPAPPQRVRRAAYMVRGYSTSRDVVPNFLQAFDVDDGRAPSPVRTQTVTASQGLFMMNSDEVDRAAGAFADRLRTESGGDLKAAIDLGYRITLARPPSAAERERALGYLGDDPAKLKGFAWLLFNLDEFIYVR